MRMARRRVALSVATLVTVGLLVGAQSLASASPARDYSATLSASGCDLSMTLTWADAPPLTQIDLFFYVDGTFIAPNKFLPPFEAPSPWTFDSGTLTAADSAHTFTDVVEFVHKSHVVASITTSVTANCALPVIPGS